MKKTLLIADDVEMNRAVIRNFLRQDFEIFEASNGIETLKIVSEFHIDALFLDIIMPEMDGFEVLQRVKAMPECRDLAILVATSAKDKAERQVLMEGADDIIAKPYDPVVIKKRLSTILKIKLLEKEYRSSELARNHDYIRQQVRNEFSVQLDALAEKIHSTSRIIEKNIANRGIVIDCAAELHAQADVLKHILD